MNDWEAELWGEKDKPAPTLPPATRTLTPQGSTAAQRYANGALDREVQNILDAKVPTNGNSGNRNTTFNNACFNMGQLVAIGAIDISVVRERLGAAGRAKQMPQHEIDNMLVRCIDDGMKQPRQLPELVKAADDDLSWVNKATGEIVEATPDASTVADFWESREPLRRIRDTAKARMTAPWATLGNALAHVIAATPHDIVLPATVGGRGSLNIFVGIVGPSGAGKGASAAAADHAIEIVGGYERKNVGTGEGLVSAFIKYQREDPGWAWVRHNCLINVAEIDTLAAVAKRQGATIMPVLRSAWSGETLGFQNRDATTALHVPAMEYRLALVAGIQPARADVLLGDSDGGTPQRFMWMPATDPNMQLPDGDAPEPWRWTGFDSMRQGDAFGQCVMTLPTHVIRTIQAERLAVVRGEAGAIAGHDTLARVKIAAALAVLDTRLEIRDEDWDLAGVVHGVSLATRAAVQAQLAESWRRSNLSAGEAEAARAEVVDEVREEAAIKRTAKRILRRLEARGPATAREIKAAASSQSRGHVDAALDRLIASGQVRIGRESKAGTDVFEVADE
jgi:hypothetical protein